MFPAESSPGETNIQPFSGKFYKWKKSVRVLGNKQENSQLVYADVLTGTRQMRGVPCNFSEYCNTSRSTVLLSL